jgi:predicted DNA-binding protein
VTKRSGPNLTDAQRSKLGYGRITLRLPAETITLIGILAHEAGLTRAQYVSELVERADAEHARKHYAGKAELARLVQEKPLQQRDD